MKMPTIPLRSILAVAVIIPMISTAVLAIALAEKTARPPVAIVIPGVREPGRIVPDDVPIEMVRDFAVTYLAVFDNFTPATVESGTAFLKSRVAPAFYTQAENALKRRKEVVLDSRMSSSVVLEKPQKARVVKRGGIHEVSARGVRRIFVAGKLREERVLIYRLRIALAMPTKLNPYGLAVVGQSIETVSMREEKEKRNAR